MQYQRFKIFYIFILFFFNMLNAQNQVILRSPFIHCQKGLLNCKKCQEVFQYQYMLLDFTVNPMLASPMIEHEGILKSYQVLKIFNSLEEAKLYADKHNIEIQISDLDTDTVLQKIQSKVKELGWHITSNKKELRIFSAYPVKELESGKYVLPEVVFSLRPWNSKISYALFYTDKYKVIDKTYYGIHSKMNPVEDNPKEDALQKVRELDSFLLQFQPK